jgi:hypothetical protein
MLLNPSPCQNSPAHNMILAIRRVANSAARRCLLGGRLDRGLLTTKSQELECRKFFPKAA